MSRSYVRMFASVNNQDKQGHQIYVLILVYILNTEVGIINVHLRMSCAGFDILGPINIQHSSELPQIIIIY